MIHTLSKQSSIRLSLLRFPLIVGIVFAHANMTPIASGQDLSISHPSFLFTFLTTLITEGMARATIPIFFLMSGFLFFLDSRWSMETYFEKLRSRAQTLLIPFLFWNIAALGLLLTAQVMPLTRPYFSGRSELLASYGPFDYLNLTFGLNRYPICRQFWFIRDLIVLVIASPLISLMIKRAWAPFVALFSLCWFFDFNPVYFPSSEAVLFFSIGGWLSSNGKDIFITDKHGAAATLFFFPVAVLDTLSFHTSLNLPAHKTGMLLAVMTCLFATKYLANTESLKRSLVWLSGAGFWVYATHWPLLPTSERLIYQAFRPSTSGQALAIFLLLPAAVILLSIGLWMIMSRIAPNFTGIVTGGRVTRPKRQDPQTSIPNLQPGLPCDTIPPLPNKRREATP